MHVGAGHPAGIVVLQDGAEGHQELGMRREEMTAMRNAESKRAAALLGVEPLFLKHADLTAEAPAAVDELARILSETLSDAIFAPFPLDGHPDHRAANYILAEALKKTGANVRVYGYEVWGLCIPNVIVVIDDAIDRKMEMLACFKFANSAVDYAASTKGLNMYHSRLLGAGMCRYAECFFEIATPAYLDLIQRIRSKEIT